MVQVCGWPRSSLPAGTVKDRPVKVSTASRAGALPLGEAATGWAATSPTPVRVASAARARRTRENGRVMSGTSQGQGLSAVTALWHDNDVTGDGLRGRPQSGA